MSHLIAFRHWLTLWWKSIMSGFSFLILLTINNNKLSPLISFIEFVWCKASIIKPSACSLYLFPAFKQFPDYKIAPNIFKYKSSVLRNSKASFNIFIFSQIASIFGSNWILKTQIFNLYGKYFIFPNSIRYFSTLS